MKTMDRIKTSIIVFFFIWAASTTAQVKSYCFAQRDTSTLWLDVYQPKAENKKDICVLYIFGGGFVKGSKTQKSNVDFFNDLAQRGYTVAAIDYRLGLKDVKKVGLFHPQPLFDAVHMATEDLISATSYLIQNHQELNIDTKRITLVGSSAGAITALIGDYELCNRSTVVRELPEDFKYAAVVSLAGGVVSTQGTPQYTTPPAPTLFLHGTKDRVVIYNKIRVFRKGLFGTNSLTKIFRKNNYPFTAIRYEGARHEVASFFRGNVELLPGFSVRDLICDFLDRSVAGTIDNEIDMLIKEQNIKKKFNRK